MIGAKQARDWYLQVVVQRATFVKEIVEANVVLPNSLRWGKQREMDGVHSRVQTRYEIGNWKLMPKKWQGRRKER